MDNYFENGTLIPDFDLFYWAFGKADVTLTAVSVTYALASLVVVLVQVIKQYNLSLFIFVPLYGILQLVLITHGVAVCAKNQLPPASAMIVSCEMARLSMKMHAYFREKILNAIMRESSISLFIPEWAQKQGMKVEDLDQPVITVETLPVELSRFLYFFFAPTLIYRD